MDGPTPFTPTTLILSVEFADNYEAIQISYIEARNVAPQANKTETVVFDAKLVPQDERDDLIDTLQQWLDAGLLHIRQEGGSD